MAVEKDRSNDQKARRATRLHIVRVSEQRDETRMTRKWGWLLMISVLVTSLPSLGQVSNQTTSTDTQQAPSEGSPAQPSDPAWQYGGFADIGYLHDFNYPSNHLFRSRGTTFHVNEVDLNMAELHLRKPTSESSRWGTELTLHRISPAPSGSGIWAQRTSHTLLQSAKDSPYRAESSAVSSDMTPCMLRTISPIRARGAPISRHT